MKISKILNGLIATLVSVVCLILPGGIIAAPPEEVPPILKEMSGRIDTLEAFVRRLHGNKAAVTRRDYSMENVNGMVDGVQIKLAFCAGPPTPSPGPGCIVNTADYVLATEVLTENDGLVVTFNADSEPNFAEVVNLLTNGDNDRLFILVEALVNGSFAQGIGFGGSERHFFFIGPQVSSGIGYDDLEGFDIGSIRLSIDSIFFPYNEADDKSRVFITDLGVFYELAE